MPPHAPLASRQILSILALAWSSSLSAAPGEAMNLAVLEFFGQGVAHAERAEVSSRLGHALSATGRFRLVAMDSLPDTSKKSSPTDVRLPWNKALETIGLRPTSDAPICTEQECAQVIGKRLNVDRVLIGRLEGHESRWLLKTKMVSSCGTIRFPPVEFRTEKGLPYLMDTGLADIALRCVAAEIRLDSLRARSGADRVRSPQDSSLEARLETDRRRWRQVAGISGFLSAGLMAGGILYSDFDGRSESCSSSPEAACTASYSNHRLAIGLLGAGAVLGAVAAVSAVIVLHDTRQLEQLRKKWTLDVSWTPLADPVSGALGLATRLDF